MAWSGRADSTRRRRSVELVERIVEDERIV
jgi:hypothetical protein